MCGCPENTLMGHKTHLRTCAAYNLVLQAGLPGLETFTLQVYIFGKDCRFARQLNGYSKEQLNKWCFSSVLRKS